MGADPSKTSNNFSTSQVEGEDTREGVNTTGFNNDANIVSATVNNYIKINSVINKSSADTTEQSVKQFLGKPNLLVSGVLSSTDTVSTFPTYQAPQSALSKAIYANKIMGFLGFRATLVLRLQINANKFQQGRYMLAFTHSGGANPTSATGVLNYLAHTNTLTARTQLPHVELDLSCDTEAVLKIPYTSCQNYTPMSAITLNNGFGAVGSFQIFPYSALVAPTGSTTASYTLWVSFEDVELITAAVPQSGRMGGKSISEKESQKAGVGPISSVMVKIRDASKLFIPVPGISSYASGLSWVADITSNAAQVFGWSKPINHSTIVKSERQTLANYAHVNTVDNGQMLAMNSKNSVDILPGFSSTDTDEMDFSYLVTIPAYARTLTWTTAQASAALIFEIGVHPMALRTSRGILGGFVADDNSPMTFIADYFNMWRGSLVYTFKFVKTEYHSGRIAICFFPHEDNVNVSARSLELSNYVHREIVDIRECSTITVAIPFVSSSPFRPIRGSGLSIGSISIYVVDPLVAPSSVSSTVSILMEVAGGPDMEFAVPRSHACYPVLRATPQSGRMNGTSSTADECGIYDGTIGSTEIMHDGVTNAAACIGEKVSSFRTLIKSMNLINRNDAYPAAAQKYCYTLPFASTFHDNTAVTPQPAHVGDLYSALSGIYALVRGGVRLKYQSSSTTSADFAPIIVGTMVDASKPTEAQVINYSNNFLNEVSDRATAHRVSGPVQFNNVFANYGAEVSVPQYHRYHSRATLDHYVHPNAPYSFAPTVTSSRFIVTYFTPANATPGTVYVARGGADDLNFGVFVSVPPTQSTTGILGPW